MAQTVVGFFDDASDARKAVERLAQQGHGQSNVDIRENTLSRENTSAGRSTDDDENGISRFFKSLFGEDNDEADRYARVGNNSRSIVTVSTRTPEEAERAADILDECGAVNVNEKAAQYNASAPNAGERGSRSDRQETVIPRVEENLEVGKRTKESGGVRVRSRIIEKPVEEHLRLREEHVNVQRRNVDRPVSSTDEKPFEERNIEMRERNEVPVVNKEARVVEEVKLSKDVSERDETIRDKVRKTEIDIDKMDEGRTPKRDNLRP